jgi:hypothetical protein
MSTFLEVLCVSSGPAKDLEEVAYQEEIIVLKEEIK